VSAKVAFVAVVALIVSGASAISALAEEKIIGPTSSPSANKIAPSGPTIEKLTTKECEGLGGKAELVGPGSDWNCTSICHVVDQFGVVRSTCIDEVKH